MEDYLTITTLNDFIFCPLSIYYHNMYSGISTDNYYSKYQTDGLKAHKTIDEKKYSTRKDILQSIDVYCEKYHLCGKIDIYYKKEGVLIERKKKIKNIYDGYIFQLYGQYFSLIEMGYKVDHLRLHSLDDNKTYEVALPDQNREMLEKFENTIRKINSFNMKDYTPANIEKCRQCIYRELCGESLYDE